MILSNEPGYYKTGAFGIRIENLELVVAAEIEGAEKPMNGFETLTLAPIDSRLINASRISKQELRWLNAYHARVRQEIRPLVDEATKMWLDAATEPLEPSR
jgi:Xaa-Pro aminopeptidase